MIILHNYYSKASREFVASNPTATVYDWYNGGQDEWEADGGRLDIRAFPTVIISIPGMTVSRNQLINSRLDHQTPLGPSDGNDNTPNHVLVASTYVIDTPSNKGAVNSEIGRLNGVLGTNIPGV